MVRYPVAVTATFSSTSSLLLLLHFLLLLLSVLPPSVGETCKPSCSSNSQGDKVVDPLSCHRYYYCQADGMPSDSSVACPDTHPVFDATLGECSNLATCSVQCLNACLKSCNQSLDLVIGPVDCGVYYVCIPGGVEGPFECTADKPYFDGLDCVNDESVCCDAEDLCQPMCTSEATEVIDPRDCRRFYVCTGPGAPSPENHFTCPNDQVFDVFWGRCSSEANCYTLCYD